MLALSVAVAVAGMLSAASAGVVRTRACEDYRPVNEVFSLPNVTYSSQYIMDVNDHVANPNSWDWNTTKIVYQQICDEHESATHEVAFVNLADCSPVTATYQRLVSMDRSFVQAYTPAIGPTINVTPDEEAVARFPCYPSYNTFSHFKYEVHFSGWHRDEMLATLGFYDKVISKP